MSQKNMVAAASGPTSAGLTNELGTVLFAEKCEKNAECGGDESESINVRAVPLDCVDQWLEDIQEKGRLVDPKIYAGLYFAKIEHPQRSCNLP